MKRLWGLLSRFPCFPSKQRRLPSQGIGTIKHIHTLTHTIHIYLPFRKSKDVEIEKCENCRSRNLTYKVCTGTHQLNGARVLTVSKTRDLLTSHKVVPGNIVSIVLALLLVVYCTCYLLSSNLAF